MIGDGVGLGVRSMWTGLSPWKTDLCRPMNSLRNTASTSQHKIAIAYYIVFGLTVNSGTQANLVGINNLYVAATPVCNGGTPWVAFASNTVSHTGGQIRTSPTISGDGKR